MSVGSKAMTFTNIQLVDSLILNNSMAIKTAAEHMSVACLSPTTEKVIHGDDDRDDNNITHAYVIKYAPDEDINNKYTRTHTPKLFPNDFGFAYVSLEGRTRPKYLSMCRL